MRTRRLPLLVERSVAESKVAGSELAESYGLQLRSRLAGEGVYITCKKGCSHCCYHPVYLSLLEGVALFQWLSENGLWTHKLKQSFVEHAEKTKNLAPEVWALSLIPCPLLDDKDRCRAYEGRPFSCRVTFSIGDPEECHPHKLGGGMLPKRDLFEMLTVTETHLLRRHHLPHFRIPLSKAVLYGERLARGEIELEECHKALWEERVHA